ncbi:hypothetical protein QWY77_03100 [Thalassotalea ponticola]|uniref:hypothetical protein n=1 Tax=Thalassotalea ponticola TaxID=1523392 RepID=UPI0025B49103|nr:hypothetical protein [Thalassotalea ponticola]MDN3651752.1 hypothetical protein [Thalassotalea ponticola]
MSERIEDALFRRWLDNTITADEAEQLEQLAAKDDVLAERLASARLLEQQALAWPSEAVPKWDKSVTYESSHKPWWQWQGLSVASMAMSVLAIALVLFNVQFSKSEQGFTVQFGQSEQLPKDIEALINQRLLAFAEEQQDVLADFNDELLSRQQDNNLKLATYVLSASRTERQQDIASVVNFVNETRQEDNLTQSIQWQQLNYQLQNQSLEAHLNTPLPTNSSDPQFAQ